MNLEILSTLWNLFSPMKGSKNSSSGEGSSQQQRCSNPTPVSLETETLTTNGFEAYNYFNDQLLHCIMTGKGESDEAEDIRNKMNDLWQHMSLEEHTAIRRHNETQMANTRRQA